MPAIVPAAPGSNLLDDVFAIYRRHSGTLGFLPRGAFEEFAADGHILVATEGEGPVGYVTYRVGGDEAVIVHFCVDEAHRGKGIARTLMDALVREVQGLRAIRLSCRKDYDANALWPRLGFVCESERPGRGADAAPLLLWRRVLEEAPALYRLLNEARIDRRPKVAIDMNVFVDLDDARARGEESRALIADWVEDLFALCVTEELRNEIHRAEDAETRQRRRSRLTQFPEIGGRPEAVAARLEIVNGILPPPTLASDESDRRQLAHAAEGGAIAFLTRDQVLLDHAAELRAVVAVQVMRPMDFLLSQDEERRRHAYEPARLLGTALQRVRLGSASREEIETRFQRFGQSEEKARWLARLREVLAHPDQYEAYATRHPDGRIFVVHALHLGDDGVATMPLLRATSDPLSPTVLRRVLAEALGDARNAGATVLRCTDGGAPLVDEALADVGFTRMGEDWVRATFDGVGTRADVLGLVEGSSPDSFRDWAFAIASSSPDVERAFWPLKVRGEGRATYVIPIQPFWAQELFDAQLAESTLFGAHAPRALGLENVYYSASPVRIPAGSRILWYVSKERGRVVREVRACSICDETVAGTPRELFRRFRRLGVYRWEHVLACAGGDAQASLLTYRFSATERFVRPIPWAELQETWTRHAGHGNPVAGPAAIPEPAFAELYVRGMGLSSPEGRPGVLVSIHPRYVAAIADGSKRVELRKRFPRVPPGTPLWIYATEPVAAIVGHASIDRVEEGEVGHIWSAHRDSVAVNEREFAAYFEGRPRGVAVVLRDFVPLPRPITLGEARARVPGFTPPQSYRYLRDGRLTRSPA
ncbi:MAG: GNAT family N-acetyltransferase [Myxococcota bacterium]